MIFQKQLAFSRITKHPVETEVLDTSRVGDVARVFRHEVACSHQPHPEGIYGGERYERSSFEGGNGSSSPVSWVEEVTWHLNLIIILHWV